MKKVIKFLTPFVFPLIKSYWFIFRPNVRGAKIILTHNGEILFVKHTYGKKYSFPGGGIKKGEEAENAVRREVKEELDISLDKITHLKTFTDTGEFKKDTIFVFTSEVPTKNVDTRNLEIEDARWLPVNNPPRLGRVAWEIFNIYIDSKRP